MRSFFFRVFFLPVIFSAFLSVLLFGEAVYAADPGQAEDHAVLPIVRGESGPELIVRLKPQERCTLGDLNAMMLDASKAGKKARLLVSIESFDSDGTNRGKPADIITSGKPGSEKSYEVRLKIPQVKTRQLGGLFICLDTEQKDSCRRKPVASFNSIVSRYELKQVPGTDKAFPKQRKALYEGKIRDKIYFFRHLILSPDKIEVPLGPMSEDRYKILPLLVSDTSPVTLSKVRSLGAALASVPLETDAGKLVVVLPVLSPARCRGAAQN